MKDIIISLFRGRLNRRNWVIGLISSFISLCLLILFFGLFLSLFKSTNIVPANLSSIFIDILVAIYFAFNISLYVRRFHDIGKSGLDVFLLLIPIINLLIFFNLAFKKGDSGKNDYGEVSSVNISFPFDILGIKK